ncbi:MAG: glycosyltransferase family 4 protein [Candidatus Edwardsbacteria bacterium]|nr:glycosyltransferase family 4 protein [Candidatus Edwardsbacteria bacterium]
MGVDISALAAGRGPARYVSEMTRALARCSGPGDAFVLYSPFPDIIDRLPRQFTHVLRPKRRQVPWLNWTLPRRARRDRIDVMYFPANDCWWRPACPTVATLLDVAPYVELKGMYRGPAHHLQACARRATIHRVAHRVVTISEYSAAAIAAWQPKLAGKITVVPCGVSEAFLAPRPARKPGPPYILFVGGFDRRKNLERLVEAFRLLVAAGREERLVLAGRRGADRALYYDIDALVSASGIAGRIDEAMACGCPVACSRAASLPEVAGDAAVYFDQIDTRNMSETIGMALDDRTLRGTLIDRGRERVRRFSWDAAGSRVHGLLREVSCR